LKLLENWKIVAAFLAIICIASAVVLVTSGSSLQEEFESKDWSNPFDLDFSDLFEESETHEPSPEELESELFLKRPRTFVLPIVAVCGVVLLMLELMVSFHYLT